MKYLDFTIQTLLILAGLGCVIAGFLDPAWYMSVLLPQFFLGCWQMAANLFLLLADDRLRALRVAHLGVAAVYLVALYAGPGLFNHLFLTVPAWALALFYYGVTWAQTFRTYKAGSSFLTHINF